MKTCTKCKLEKEESEFYCFTAKGDKEPKTRMQSYCKECNSQYLKERKEHITKLKLKKRWENPEVKAKEWEHARQIRIANRERCLLNAARSRARRNNLEFDLELSDIFIPLECPVLKIILTRNDMKMCDPNAPSLDRFDTTKGYTKDNVWVISNRANRMKNNASLEELKIFCENLIKNLKKWQK